LKKAIKRKQNDLRSEYDLSELKGAVRGKYVDRYHAGTNLILLAPDVVKYFPDEKSVNTALRSLIHIVKTSRQPAR